MGTLFSTLDIGRAGMVAAQSQLDVSAHNIANVNKEGFSRQRVMLSTRVPNYTFNGAFGRGPGIDNVMRIRDPFLDTIYRAQTPKLGEAEVKARYFAQMENVFLEPSETGFSTRVGVFFDALNDFADNVEDLPVRVALLAEAESLAESFTVVDKRFDTLRTDANEEIRNLTIQINSLSSRIAELNGNIRDLELGGTSANDLRDDRDILLDELSQLVNITTREVTDGTVTVLMGGEDFIHTTEYRRLSAVQNPALDPERVDLLDVVFEDTGLPVYITSGELQGALDIRDQLIPELMGKMDTMAAAIIEQMNQIHSQGNGLAFYTDPMTTTHPVSDPAVALDSAGLPFTMQAGSFDILVYDESTVPPTLAETVTVNVDPATDSLNDVINSINAATNVTASAFSTGHLGITPNAGYSFSFANDSANALPALGANILFTGHDAGSIGVNQVLIDNPELLTSGYSPDPLATGENQAALDMVSMRGLDIFNSNTQNLNEFFESTIVTLGVDSRTNIQQLDVEQAFVNDYNNRRQQVSSVSLDEEVSNLVLYQRAFEAAARIITVTDSMLDTLLSIVR